MVAGTTSMGPSGDVVVGVGGGREGRGVDVLTVGVWVDTCAPRDASSACKEARDGVSDSDVLGVSFTICWVRYVEVVLRLGWDTLIAALLGNFRGRFGICNHIQKWYSTHMSVNVLQHKQHTGWSWSKWPWPWHSNGLHHLARLAIQPHWGPLCAQIKCHYKGLPIVPLNSASGAAFC